MSPLQQAIRDTLETAVRIDGPGDLPIYRFERDPEAIAATLRGQMSAALRKALVKGLYVDWGHGTPYQLAADAIHECGLGNAEAESVWRDLHAAIANGVPDADVAALARHYQRVCFSLCVESLTDCAMDGKRIVFPERLR